MFFIRIFLVALLFCAASASASPKAQYKVGGGKSWKNAKTSSKPKSSAQTSKTKKKAGLTGSSAPKYRLSLPPNPLEITLGQNGKPILNQIPRFPAELKGTVTGVTAKNEFIYYTLDPALQTFSDRIVARARAPHIAVVVMQPTTGRILAISEKSTIYDDLSIHSRFPAASLFKVITAAAALEKAGIDPMTEVSFRGGVYTLNEFNYRADARRDQNSMSVAEALGRSCNPVFGRLGLAYLDVPTLRSYVRAFGFNEAIPFEAPLPPSTAVIPESDYHFSRTCAGFGAVTVSPVHAAALMSAVANRGLMPQPSFVDHVVSANGKLMYQSRPTLLRKALSPETAQTLLNMMEYTTTIGTSRREFGANKASRMRNIRVAAKTGTLRGDDPKGLNHWFIAAAPVEKPRIAVAIISVDSGSPDSKPSRIGRMIMEKFLFG